MLRSIIEVTIPTKLPVLIVNRPAAIAWADGSGDLERILIPARNNSCAQGESETLWMADNKNIFAFVDGVLP